MRLNGKVAMYGARLLSVSRQVGAHLWHEGPAGALGGIQTHNFSTLACLEVLALPLSYLLLLCLTHWDNCDKYYSLATA